MGAAPPEDRVPVVRNADNSPVAFCSSFQGLFRAADVVELSVVVVVQDKQTEGGPVQLLGELRYRDVAVGVAGEYGRRPVRLQMRTSFSVPSSRESAFTLWLRVPPSSPLTYSSVVALPMTRSRGMP